MRPLQLADAPRCVSWFQDTRVTRYLLLQRGFSLEEEKKYIRSLAKKKNHFNLAILTELGTHIGTTGTTLFPEDKRAHIGIVIGETSEWGKGYAAEALCLVADYIFKQLHYIRLELIVSMDNTRALAAYKKAGFTLEGIKRKSHWNTITKTHEDEGMMSMLQEEWAIQNLKK